MKTETLARIIGGVDVGRALVSFMGEKAQKKWSGMESGELIGVHIHGQHEYDAAALCMENGFLFKRRGSSFCYDAPNSEEAEKCLAFLNKIKRSSCWFVAREIRENPFDRYLDSRNIVHSVVRGGEEKACIVGSSEGNGHYDVRETSDAFECWMNESVNDGSSYGVKELDRFELNEPERFGFVCPGVAERGFDCSFVLQPGVYAVEAKWDDSNDDGYAMLRVRRLERKTQRSPFSSELFEFMKNKGVLLPESLSDDIASFLQVRIDEAAEKIAEELRKKFGEPEQ